MNSPEAKAGLQSLADAYKNGNIPKEAITFQEEQGRQAFQDGKLLFLRNWPYVYNLATTEGSSKVKDKFGVAPLPGVDGPGASSLGGHSAGHQRLLQEQGHRPGLPEVHRRRTTSRSSSGAGLAGPGRSARSTSDKELVAKLPYLPALLTSIENAVPRPVTPFYPAVTKAIQDNAYAAIKGEKTVDQAHHGHAEVPSQSASQRLIGQQVRRCGAGVTPPHAGPARLPSRRGRSIRSQPQRPRRRRGSLPGADARA